MKKWVWPNNVDHVQNPRTIYDHVLYLLGALIVQMAQEEAYKAVERVLTGAVSKVLQSFKAKPGRGKPAAQAQREGRDSPLSSSDDADFQQAPVRKKAKSSK